MGNSLDLGNFQTVWKDDFTHDGSLNTSIFQRVWGDGNEFKFNNGLTLASDGNAAGFLTMDGSPGDSMGYGLYQATLSVPSNNQQPGIAVVLWPASNNFPGPEIDLMEQLNGQNYVTVHWDNGGTNYYQAYVCPGLDLTKPTTMAVDWEKSGITFYVNGQQLVQYGAGGSVPIPADASDGGQNEAFGAEVSGSGQQVTLYDMSYSKYTGGGGGGQPAAAQITPANTNSGTAQFAAAGNTNTGSSQSLATSAGTDILHGSAGLDTFTMNAAGSDGWAEITDFHGGDVALIVGFVQGQSSINWTDATDPNGQSGATANISLAGNGHTDLAVTFAGVSVADAQKFGSGEWHTGGGAPELGLWHV